MKNIKINIEGKSQIAFVSFYNAEILQKLKEIDGVEFDLINFISAHEKHDKNYDSMLGRGFCMDHQPVITVSGGDAVMYEGPIYDVDYNSDPSQMKVNFQESYGVDYDRVISNGTERWLGVDSFHFQNANKYKYCSLEKVECIKASSLVNIEVEDNFKLSDLNVVFTCMDDGAEDSITQLLYHETDFELQVHGIKYKGVFYEFEGNYSGSGNEFFWYENNNNSWTPSFEISSRIEKLCDWDM